MEESHRQCWEATAPQQKDANSKCTKSNIKYECRFTCRFISTTKIIQMTSHQKKSHEISTNLPEILGCSSLKGHRGTSKALYNLVLDPRHLRTSKVEMIEGLGFFGYNGNQIFVMGIQSLPKDIMGFCKDMK